MRPPATSSSPELPLNYPAPPWAFKGEGCPTCLVAGTPGFSQSDSFCPICVSWTEKNRISPEHFFLGRNKEGDLVWTIRENYAHLAPYLDDKVLLESEVEFVCDSADAVSFLNNKGTAVTEDADEDETPAKEKRAKPSISFSTKPAAGRPPKSFKLIRGYVAKFPVTKEGTGRFVVHGDDILEQGKAHVTLQSGAISFYDLEHLPALDALRRWAEEDLAPKLKANADLVVFSPDYAQGGAEQAVFTTLRRFAETVIC